MSQNQNQNRIHMVPQIVIDVAENLMNAKHDHMKDNYTLRLEAIRDYCDAALKQASNPTRQVFDRKKKIINPNDARKWSS